MCVVFHGERETSEGAGREVESEGGGGGGGGGGGVRTVMQNTRTCQLQRKT